MAAGILIGAQRFRLPAGAIEGHHQLCPKAFSQRVPAGQGFDLSNQSSVAARRKLGVDAVLNGCQALLIEPHDRRSQTPLVGKVRERGSSPHRQGFSEHRCRPDRIAIEQSSSPRQLFLESQPIGIGSVEMESVPRLNAGDDLAAEEPAQTRHVRLKGTASRLRRIIPPHLVDETVGRHSLVGVDEQHGEYRTLAAATQGQRSPPVDDLQRPQNPEVHVITVQPVRERV